MPDPYEELHNLHQSISWLIRSAYWKNRTLFLQSVTIYKWVQAFKELVRLCPTLNVYAENYLPIWWRWKLWTTDAGAPLNSWLKTFEKRLPDNPLFYHVRIVQWKVLPRNLTTGPAGALGLNAPDFRTVRSKCLLLNQSFLVIFKSTKIWDAEPGTQ